MPALLDWHEENRRQLPWRVDREPYHVWLSEIMLQQTRIEAVIPYYERFLRELPDIAALSRVDDERLMKLWEGLGYYSRARNLKRAAEVIMKEYGGIFPSEETAVRKLPGIGPYTAGAVLSLSFGKPVPAVDGNVLRIYARFTVLPEEVDRPEVKRAVTKELEKAYRFGDPAMLTEGLMELGQKVCLPNGQPHCMECPVRAFCKARKTGTQADYPRRLPKRKRTKEKRILAILLCDGKVAISRRKNSGLLAGLWEFPAAWHGDADQGFATHAEDTALRFAEACGAHPTELLMKSTYTHVFTHKEWEMEAVYIRCGAPSGPFTWATPEELTEMYALPSAFRPFLDLVSKIAKSK